MGLLDLDRYDLGFLICMIVHVFAAPYTKVEEIFQVNNIYDHIYLMQDVKNYDFVEFPGVVYRTFISSLLIAFFDFPFKYLFKALGLTCFSMHILSRLTLGLLNFASLRYLRKQVRMKYADPYISNAFFLIYMVQFHTVFYMSRPLPNTFALIFCNFAFGHWLMNRWHWTVVFLALATIVFRCDIGVLAISMFVFDFVRGRFNMQMFKKVFVCGLIASIIFISATIVIDTYFWREYFNQKLRKDPNEKFYMWPELYVLHYNTVLNKSHEWGVSPWYWYFLIAIPKSVTCALGFIIIGLFYRTKGFIVDKAIVEAIAPAVIFVGLYSFLPHKELRFIFPALTLFNLGGAMGLAKVLRKLSKNDVLNNLLLLISYGMLGLSLVFTAFSLYVSHLNYPGGTALKYFNQDYLSEMRINPQLPKPYIHSDVYASMTGFNRFLYENEHLGWRYNRTENMPDHEYLVYTHLITDRQDYDGFSLYKQPIKAYDRVDLRGFIKNPLRNNLIMQEDKIYILERNDVQRLRLGGQVTSEVKV